jgi:hypothetical protein
MKRRSLLCGAVSAVPTAWAGTSRLESLRWLPEDRIDVGRASFALSQELYPSVDIESFSRQLDALAAAVRRRVTSRNDPEERVWAMNTVFFQERGLESSSLCKFESAAVQRSVRLGRLSLQPAVSARSALRAISSAPPNARSRPRLRKTRVEPPP